VDRRARAAGRGTTIQARIDRRTGVRKGPTVVLLSGLDTPLDVWAKVRTGLAGDAPVFSYDRGGVDRSGPVTGERPSSVVARELHETLAAAGLTPPYLLVAHSLAGVHARVFADRYRAEVAGVVLIDATHEMLLAGMTRSRSPTVAAGSSTTARRPRCSRSARAPPRRRPAACPTCRSP
jgi:pimeloyl-ACP methyl ester carboxylesterase